MDAEKLALLRLLLELTDEDPCYFDHHGGCQAHGFLELSQGEKCPHFEAKEYLAKYQTEITEMLGD